ncbi:MAG: PhoX family phosphatase [Castellaniella sp.]|uniref:PhoX family protein n=1 Tax=Castellaniella sp. TaxID=1955812 RepID=UPI002A359A46|nr:PhoX family phosphatase [Castellaniella sp.]MDY0309027.1 PhoX family phosphatase [Castellaniella sp.]
MKHFDLDDIPANPSTAESLDQLLARLDGRRRFLKGGLGLGAVSFLGGLLPAAQALAADAATRHPATLGFKAVPMSTADTVVVPEGYAHAVINRWGDPLAAGAPAFKSDASDDSAAQAMQFGYNHDGLHFFPIDGQDGVSGSSTEGLLVTNHEYVTPHYFFPKGVQPGGTGWNLDWIRKAQHAQGVSVVHIRLDAQGRWQRVPDSPYNRMIHANTPIHITGPAAGHPLLRTQADPGGTQVLGTFGNCGNGWTPWNTYLTCEENFTDYFGTGRRAPEQADYPNEDYRRHMQRYKGGSKASDPEYAWDTHDVRFDWTQEPNEYNRHGWVVEIDPFDPSAAPRKLTALGRFKHENAALTLAQDGRVVVYMGDDQRSEYIYKFVSEGAYRPGAASNRTLLEQGTLYAARFDADGKGAWIPLTLDTLDTQGRRLGERFNENLGELLIHTRQAADAVGATPMDRPEWIAVHPRTGEAYATLTNNTDRGSDKARWPDGPKHPGADAANPRDKNIYGHIVRWREADRDPRGTVFEWDLFALAGNPTRYTDGDPRRGSANISADNTFNSPDGLGFDAQGRLWVLTDGNYKNRGDYEGQGNNQMLVADPVSGELRRFLTGPKGCEVTGITWTPDQRFVFVNIQHPGEGPDLDEAQAAPLSASSWPDGPQATRPRPATVVIWKKDGGVIGS